MNLLVVFCGLLYLLGGVCGVEKWDASYECLKNAIEKMSNSSCPLITPEVERDIDEYARLYTACLKENYLINGCNESEWVHACTRRVANIPTSSREYKDFEVMWKNCNEGVKDPNFECFTKLTGIRTNDSCPELATEASKEYNLKTKMTIKLACIKKNYVQKGCNANEWSRVCNKQIDKLNVEMAGGQDVIDTFRFFCDEKYQDPCYKCFENAIAEMNDSSCREVLDAKAQNETTEEIARHQILCFKQLFANNGCKIADWEKFCILQIFSFKKSWKESMLLLKYCKL